MRDYLTDQTPFAEALAGQYRLSPISVLREGWNLFRRFTWETMLFTLGALLCMGVVWGGLSWMVWLVRRFELSFLNNLIGWIAYIGQYGFTFAVMAGLLAAYAHHMRREAVTFWVYIAGLRRLWSISAAKVLQLIILTVPVKLTFGLWGWMDAGAPPTELPDPTRWVAVVWHGLLEQGLAPALWIGLIAFMVVQTLYLLTTPLILVGHLHFWTAMEVSRKIVWHQPGRFMGLLGICMVLWLIGFFSAGMGFLVTLPLIYATQYVAYTQIAPTETPFWEVPASSTSPGFGGPPGQKA